MSASLDRRIRRLEGAHPRRESLSRVLSVLREIGYEELHRMVVPLDMEMPDVLLLSVVGTDIFDLEGFRGLVPDGDIRAVYSFCRNYVYAPDKARLIRERAGVIDGQGSVTPGYVLLGNGCIVEAGNERQDRGIEMLEAKVAPRSSPIRARPLNPAPPKHTPAETALPGAPVVWDTDGTLNGKTGSYPQAATAKP